MPSDKQATGPKKDLPTSSQEIESLKSQLATAKQHRQELLNRLDKLENQTKQAGATYRWGLLTLAQLLPIDKDKHLARHLNRVKRLAKDEAGVEDIKTAIMRLKDAAVKEDIKPPEGKKERSLHPSLLKWLRKDNKTTDEPPVGATDSIGPIKETYQEILNELRLNLDENALAELLSIEKQLHRAKQMDDLIAIRKTMMNLIKKYIARISTEREEAASFIREIGERLIEVEGHMINSISFTKDTQAVSSTFTDTIDGQLADFKQSINISNSLSELKTAVVTRLSSIKSTIESKRQDDSTRLKQAGQQMEKLQKNMTEMKGEIQTAWKRAKTLERELLIDPLTGIYNRRAYDRRVVEEVQRYQRYDRAFSLLIFDVDHFKQVNDNYGHGIGDLCLKEIIKRIRPVLRKSDFLARYGGEEFVVLVPETHTVGAADVAEKIRKTIEDTDFIHKSDSIKITVSIGITEINTSDKTHEDIFTRADDALYNAKQAGRNRVATL